MAKRRPGEGRLNVYEEVIVQALEEAWARTTIPIRKEMYMQMAEAIASGDVKVLKLSDLFGSIEGPGDVPPDVEGK